MKNKRILVTGASRGIGKEIACALAAQGYDLYLCCNKSIEELSEIGDELVDKYKINVRVFQCNLSSSEDILKMTEEINKDGGLYAIINNAGVSYVGLVTQMSDFDWNNVIERQLKKYKSKIVDKQERNSAFQPSFIENDFDEDEEIKIIRSKKFDIKPMYPEDACIQMELLGHDFFVFCNAETDQVNVVYKRKGNTYGLIEPED